MSINLTALPEYIYLMMYGPTQFRLNFLFIYWTGARISFNTKGLFDFPIT